MGSHCGILAGLELPKAGLKLTEMDPAMLGPKAGAVTTRSPDAILISVHSTHAERAS